MNCSTAVDSRTATRIASRVQATAVAVDPGPHLVLHDLLPEPVYASLLAMIPPTESFDVADAVKADFDPLLSTRAPAASVQAWRAFMTDVVEPILTPALLRKFDPYLDSLFEGLFGSFAARARQLTLVAFRSRLMLRRPGYRLMPHRDTKIVVITGLIYFARPGDSPDHGTDLFRVSGDRQAPFMKTFYPEKFGASATHVERVPFLPNSALAFLNVPGMAHGATFPADAAQRERYAYQFYIGPREDDLVALLREMASDARAMWVGLPDL